MTTAAVIIDHHQGLDRQFRERKLTRAQVRDVLARRRALPPLCMITITPDTAKAARERLAEHDALDLAAMLGIEEA